MSITRCPNACPECPYFDRPAPKKLQAEQSHGCYADEDHIVPKRLGGTILNNAYINLPVNKQQLCRWKHEQKTEDGDEPLPPIPEMVEAIQTAEEAGQLRVHKQLRRVMYRLLQSSGEAG